jgi:predicted Rossmann fold nucleotide-binding protein DprA/Smf involved in DNA uptake
VVPSMHAPTDSALASLLLTDRTVERDVQPLSPKEYWSVMRVVGDPAKLLGQDAAWLAETTGLSRQEGERLAKLLDGATGLAFQLERMERSGFLALTPLDEDYPQRLLERLGDVTPPVLYAVGQTKLLSSEGIGIVGSRDLSNQAEEVARQSAELVVRAGLTVISGGAKGVDQTAMRGALEAGGFIVGILADSLERKVKDQETRRLIAEERLCLASPYKPSAGFTVANAMGRNKLIYALARRTLVVSTSIGQGGTWQGATEALKRRFGEVAVWLGPGMGPGNRELEAAGAVGIQNLDELFAPPTSPAREQTEDLQLRLDL